MKNTPLPVYKGAPILFLLKPEEATYAPVFVAYYKNGIERTLQRMSLKKPTIGDITLTASYTWQEIMALYREENTSGGILHSSLENYVNKKNAMGKNDLFGYIYPQKNFGK